MNILLVKLSSLGDVVHTLPVVQDIHQALPGTQIDWVVEQAFAPLPALLPGVRRVVACNIRHWRRHLFSRATWVAWQAFCTQLQTQRYDAIIDLQGLGKSAIVARLARLAPGGQRFAMANRTDGSGYESLTRWLADVALPLPVHSHAVQRGRTLAALALGYAEPQSAPDFGLQGLKKVKKAKNSCFSASKVPPNPTLPAQAAMNLIATSDAPTFPGKPLVVWVHGSSRANKCWPASHWLALGLRLHAAGWRVALVHGNAAEAVASQAMADALNAAVAANSRDCGDHAAVVEPVATVWPGMPLDALAQMLAQECDTDSSTSSHEASGQPGGVIGVDSGISHLAVALGLPHVQLYNFDTAWRTGPLGQPHQASVYAQPVPSVEAVWQAWLECSGRLNPDLAASDAAAALDNPVHPSDKNATSAFTA